MSKYLKATIVIAEKLTTGTVVSYELILKDAPQKELILTPEGKPVK